LVKRIISTAVQEAREGKWNKMAEGRDLEVARDWERMRERRCHCVWRHKMCTTGCVIKMLRNGKVERTCM